jgi:hypothetical protein
MTVLQKCKTECSNSEYVNIVFVVYCVNIVLFEANFRYSAHNSMQHLTVAQVIKKLPLFIQPVGPLPCSQKPSTGPYSEP